MYLSKGKTMKNIVTLVVFPWIHYVGAAREGFVVGGQETEIQKYPHSVFLFAYCSKSEFWICGAAILNQQLLITAAHCVDGCDWVHKEHSRLVAFMGHDNLKMVTIKRQIMHVRIHHDYEKVSMANDIAVALMRQPVPLGPTVKRVIITKEYPQYARVGMVAGWGIIDENGKVFSLTLKHVKQTVRDHQTCSLVGRLQEGMFCAGSTLKNSEHPAKGDSGSAMVTFLGFHQIGVVSFCVNKYPGLMVYTNVSYYYNWIYYNANLLYC